MPGTDGEPPRRLAGTAPSGSTAADRQVVGGEVQTAGRGRDLVAELHVTDGLVAEPALGVLDPLQDRQDVHRSGAGVGGADEREDLVGAVGALVDGPGVTAQRHVALRGAERPDGTGL